MFKKIHSKFTNKMIEIYVKFSYPTSNTYTLDISWRRNYLYRIIDFLDVVII